MTTYHQEVILAMELNRFHVGKLVQIITDSWSMTGTLTRVDQHDNREWEIEFPSRRMVPRSGEIYAELWIGPWRGQVVGNQPVTVETVKGTLEAPERKHQPNPRAGLTRFISDEEMAEARAVIEGTALGPEEPRPWLAANGNRFTADQAKLITERLLYRPEGDLPPGGGWSADAED